MEEGGRVREVVMVMVGKGPTPGMFGLV